MKRAFICGLALVLSGTAAASETNRYDLSPSDARRVRELELQHRLDQQQLELEHQQRLRLLERRHARLPDEHTQHRLLLERDLLRQERALHDRRFELDRQRLLQSMPRQPLEPRTPSGTLRLP